MKLPYVRSKARWSASMMTASACVLTGLAIPSTAAAWVSDFPAPWACTFDLRVQGSENPHRVYREFHDKNGNVVRWFEAGKGAPLTFTNLSTGASLTLKANGSTQTATTAPDGTSMYVNTGHVVLIWFPTDIPAGPSTTQYVGRVVYSVDPSQTWTLLGSSGRTVDICAALSG